MNPLIVAKTVKLGKSADVRHVRNMLYIAQYCWDPHNIVPLTDHAYFLKLCKDNYYLAYDPNTEVIIVRADRYKALCKELDALPFVLHACYQHRINRLVLEDDSAYDIHVMAQLLFAISKLNTTDIDRLVKYTRFINKTELQVALDKLLSF